jgi:hypothetical protein
MTRIAATPVATAATTVGGAGDAPRYVACSLQASPLAKEGHASIENQARSSLNAPIQKISPNDCHHGRSNHHYKRLG